MLVLARKLNEKIVIDNHITITVVEVGHGRVRLGIEAPPAVKVDRAEIASAKLANPQDAAVNTTPAPSPSRCAPKLPA